MKTSVVVEIDDEPALRVVYEAGGHVCYLADL
jgi:hypothetical protein